MKRASQSVSQTGFTLVNLMVTLAIAAVLVTVAIPAMSSVIAGSRVTSEVNSLLTHLQMARSEAIKRGQRAVLCSSADGTRCLGSKDWDQGYLLFVDTDADRRVDEGEPVIQFKKLDGESVDLDAGRRKSVAYQSSGWAPGSNLTFTICDPAGRVPPKAVVVSNTGRARVAKIHPNGSELSCAP